MGRSRFRHWVDAAEKAITYYGLGVMVLFMGLFITGEILSRLLFGYSFLGVVELVEQMVVILAYLSIAAVQKDRKHITVDILQEKLARRRAGPILDCTLLAISSAVMIFFLVEVAWYGFVAYHRGLTTTTLFWPVWPFIFLMAFGGLMMVLRLFTQLMDSLSKVRSGRPFVEKGPERA